MAYVKKNIVTEGLSGKLGNSIVFCNVGGKTVVAVKPDTSQRKDSEAQKQHQRKFRAGASYAKQAAQDPVMREAYGLRAKPGQSPYNVALADYLNAPEIEAVDLHFFSGAKGSPVVMQVMDDHEDGSIFFGKVKQNILFRLFRLLSLDRTMKYNENVD